MVVVLCATGSVYIADAIAEDGAHGREAKPVAKSNLNEPGEAVKAPRKTERYTEKGMTVDPVAFDIAPNGDIYVAEGSRASGAVIDNRNQGLRDSNGVIDDLQKTSVEDRLEQIERLIAGGYYPEGTFTNVADRVRLVKDADGDGKADGSTIFADNFNEPLDGIAAGVLYHNGKVYLTNIPHLWLLEDIDGDGDADKTTQGERTSLSYGYGIRWAFYGHDMHGLVKGPDGRIYFSLGDRGYNVKTKEGNHLYGPDRGAVFRMWPDGSELEIYFEGLRNPQELAFDNYGNLFTGDNNSDGGDKARFAYLPEGGDAGWRQDVQSLNDRGPWNREHMWKPRDTEQYGLMQPAWIVPPLANVGKGPAGLTHYPGTGDAFPSNGSFLLCDYPSGVRHVRLQPDGAMFKVVEDSQLPVQGRTITDVTWGYDGRLYLSDWGGGWQPNPNGYIKTMINEAAHAEQAELIAEVKSLFAQGFEKRTDEKLIELLGHADQRVRIHAQWEVATRSVTEKLTAVAGDRSQTELARLHAIWALGMRAHSEDTQKPTIATALTQLLQDESAYVRGQAALTLGEIGQPAGEALRTALSDANPKVVYHAAMALGKTGDASDVASMLNLLDRNDNKDVAIRHAASYGLSLIGDAEKIASEMKSRDSAARLGGVLALRRLDSPLLADFLADDDAVVAAEAARAIYDKRIMEAMSALAELADTLPAERISEPVMRRIVEANVRLADESSAMRLARFAANAEAPEMWRTLALQELNDWATQRNREGVWGAWWPRPEQTMKDAMAAMLTNLEAILASTQGELQDLARAIVLDNYSVQEIEALALNADESAGLRAVAMRVLTERDTSKGEQAARSILFEQDAPAELRIPVRALLLPIDQRAAISSYLAAFDSGETIEQQDAVHRLGPLKDEQAMELMAMLATQLASDQLPDALRLDVYEALKRNTHLPSQTRFAANQYEEAHAIELDEPFIRDAVLAGGSVMRGKEIFLNQGAAECQRCHAIDGSDNVGPGLNGIAALYDANYLYEALVHPGNAIANGYANTTVNLTNGNSASGRILTDRSTGDMLVLTNADGVITEIPRDQIVGEPIISDMSLMPTMKDKLSPGELRDVIAYLGSLTDNPSTTYRTVPVSGGKNLGPQVAKPAADFEHVIWLPVVLLSIAASLVALLLATILGAQLSQP